MEVDQRLAGRRLADAGRHLGRLGMLWQPAPAMATNIDKDNNFKYFISLVSEFQPINIPPAPGSQNRGGGLFFPADTLCFHIAPHAAGASLAPVSTGCPGTVNSPDARVRRRGAGQISSPSR